MDCTRPLLPESTTPARWKRFVDVALAWVIRHREALMRNDWISETYWLKNLPASASGV
jgi:hypothetical protein